MAFDSEARLAEWHQLVTTKDFSLLSNFLAGDIVFYSPVFWKPKQGKMAAFVILSTVITVLEGFAYHRQWIDPNDWALEFSAYIGDKQIKGIDLMQFNADGQIISFEVLVRPLNGLQALGEEMRQRLAALGVPM